MILSHRDVQTHSRLSKKKLVFKKRRLKNVSFQRLERKLKTQVTLSTLAKLSMTNLSRLHYKLKHKPHRVLPFLISDFQWAHKNFSLIWSVPKSRVFVFVLVVVKNISRDGNKFTPQKFTVTSYKYIVLKKIKIMTSATCLQTVEAVRGPDSRLTHQLHRMAFLCCCFF